MKIVFKCFPRYVLVYAQNLQGNKYVISVFEFFSLTYFLLIRIKAFSPLFYVLYGLLFEI